MRCSSKSTTWRGSAALALAIVCAAGPLRAQASHPPQEGARQKPAPFAVRAGDRVTLVAVIGDLRVETAAVALQSGREGDIVRVTNPDSRRQLSGTVIGKEIVEVLHE